MTARSTPWAASRTASDSGWLMRAIEARKTGRERGDEVRIGAAEGHGLQKLV